MTNLQRRVVYSILRGAGEWSGSEPDIEYTLPFTGNEESEWRCEILNKILENW